MNQTTKVVLPKTYRDRELASAQEATTAGSGPATRATPGAPLGLLALLCLRLCRNYKVSDERTHRIAIQAERLEVDIRDSWPTGSSSAYSATRRLNLTIPPAALHRSYPGQNPQSVSIADGYRPSCPISAINPSANVPRQLM